MTLKRVLVANRGEIAVRIIRAAHALGIEAVQAVSAADRDSLAARLADQVVVLGPAPSRASYLDANLIVHAARATGCDALHPGYGFLSERAHLAREFAGERAQRGAGGLGRARGDQVGDRFRLHEVELAVVERALRELAGARQPRAELDGARPEVLGDRVHLQQVLLNLIINAMDAMADTPVPLRCVVVRTVAQPDGSVEVAVVDRGQGVAPERLPRLFDSFYTTKERGMGLGLSISKSIVEAHGGRIWAEGNAGGGATFRFTLPVSAGVFKPVMQERPA